MIRIIQIQFTMQVQEFYQSIRPQRTHIKRQFQYPNLQIFANLKFRTVQYLLEYLNQNKPQQIQFSSRKRGKYFYIHCRYCKSKLSFFIGQDQLRVIKAQNIHNHQNKQCKKHKQELIYNFICENIQSKSLCSLTTKKFNISERKFYYLLQKQSKGISLQKIIQDLDLLNYESRIDYNQQNQKPTIFLTVSPHMIQLGRKFADSISFDITYNVLKNCPFNGVGLFTGFDTNLRIILLGIVLVQNQTIQTIKKVFQQFIDIHRCYRATIITDGQHSFRNALEQLKNQNFFLGVHSSDIFHILRNLKKRVGNTDIQLYRKLARAKNRSEFKDLYAGLFGDSTNQYLKNFVSNGQRYVLALHPDQFVGFYIGTAGNEKMNDILKNIIERQSNIWKLFQAIKRIDGQIYTKTKLPEIENKKFEILFKDQGIRKVREKIECKIFKKFLQIYCQAMRLNSQKIDNQTLKIGDYEIKRHQCYCGYFFKTGILCEHTLKSIWETSGNHNYIDFISQRWKIKIQRDTKNIGRGISSRKNRH